MISDVLYEVIIDIKKYQKELPQCYEKDRSRIEELLKHMEEVMAYFDTPPKKLLRRVKK